MGTEKETEEKIQQLQIYEQSSQNIILQKQQFQSQLTEIDSALKGLEKASESYKIIGNIMVKSDSLELKKELEDKKVAVELRIKTMEKQENSIKEKIEKLQREVMENMKDKDSD
jgi:prefoldin beta subunit